MTPQIPSIVEFSKKISLEQLNDLNPKSSHLMRLIRNVDSLITDAEILDKNGGSRERVLFLYLTAFEQLHVTLALMDDMEKLPFGHSKNLAPLDTTITKIKDIFKIEDVNIMTIRNSCLYEDSEFKVEQKFAKYITHLTIFLPKLKTSCTDILSNIEMRWHSSFKMYSDQGHEAYERSYQESKKKK